MSEANVDRVREDLAIMSQALGTRLPYGEESIWLSLVLAAVGAAVAAITALTGIAAMPVESGSPSNLAYGALIVLPVLLVFAIGGVVSYRRKAQSPLSWREARQNTVAAFIAVPLFLGFVVWSTRNGLSASTVIATTAFLGGLLWMLWPVYDQRRRHVLGWAISTMLLGAVLPLGTYQTAGIFAGGWLLFGGLSTAAIMAWQRRHGGEHGHRL